MIWQAPAPDQCEICSEPISNEFVDGKTRLGPWAIMCSPCFTAGPGMGKLGLGLGQKYKLNRRNEFERAPYV